MSLRLYDTRLRRKVPFEPLVAGKVGMYACGITVYDLCHVGHARMLVAWDVIARYLRASGLTVTYVLQRLRRPDRQDCIRKANTEGVASHEIAERYTRLMHEDMAALGLAPADYEPRATEHIGEVVDITRRLGGEGPRVSRGRRRVYYHVEGFGPSSGTLSGQHIDDLKAGVRIEVDEHKKSPLDFALWKGAKPGEPSWESPWGAGRPGWHIECSAMAHELLGEPFDIHGGGEDLIFPHHTNEIAQTEGACGEGQVARPWMPSGMVNFGGEKMSKSLGNVVNIRKVQATNDLEALRLLFVSNHYRSPVGFTIGKDDKDGEIFPDLDDAEKRLEYFYGVLERLDQAGVAAVPEAELAGEVVPPADRTLAAFREAMDDDFNTAAAVGRPLRLVRARQQIARRAEVGAQGRPPAHARSAAARPRRVRRDAGHLPPPARRVPARAPRASVRTVRDRSSRGRGQDHRAHRGAGREGLRARRRDPQGAQGRPGRGSWTRRRARPGAWLEGSSPEIQPEPPPVADCGAGWPLRAALTRSRSSLPTLKKASRFGLTCTASPVRGFRPWYSR